VLIERMQKEAADLTPAIDPLVRELERRRERARARLLSDLRSQRYLDLLDRLVDAAHDPQLSGRARRASRKELPRLVRRSWRKAAQAGRSLDKQSDDADYHRVRVLTKRVRYAAEAVAPALGGEPSRLARRAADVQDVLGELQDSVVAAEAIETAAHARPDEGAFNLAAGRMLEREGRARADARAAFGKAWRKLDRRKLRRWI
jgi:CHAD domain-containing protein